MWVEAAHRPAHLRSRAQHSAVEVDRETAQPQPFDLLEHQLGHQRAQGSPPGHREALEPICHRAVRRQSAQSAEASEQGITSEVAQVFGAPPSYQHQAHYTQHQPERSVVAAYIERCQCSPQAAAQINAPTIPTHQLQSGVRGQPFGTKDYWKISFDDAAKRRYRKPHSGGLPFGRDLCGHTGSQPYRRPLSVPMITSLTPQVFSDWG
jgi:hypothetical protein